MAGWKKILLTGDAATLGDTAPVSVGTTPAAGTGNTGSRADHVHEIGTGAIDGATMFAAGVVNQAAIGANAVGASELIETDAYEVKELTLTPAVSSASTIVGTVFYDSDDGHPYVYQA